MCGGWKGKRKRKLLENLPVAYFDANSYLITSNIGFTIFGTKIVVKYM